MIGMCEITVIVICDCTLYVKAFVILIYRSLLLSYLLLFSQKCNKSNWNFFLPINKISEKFKILFKKKKKSYEWTIFYNFLIMLNVLSPYPVWLKINSKIIISDQIEKYKNSTPLFQKKKYIKIPANLIFYVFTIQKTSNKLVSFGQKSFNRFRAKIPVMKYNKKYKKNKTCYIFL